MPTLHLPVPGQPHAIVEAAGEAGLDELDTALVVDLYKRHGALLFRGFGADVAQFRGFSRRFSSTAVVNESPGRIPIDPEAHIQSVDGGTGPFALHPELSREPWKPDVAIFCCLSAPTLGGQTTICDGIALVREMPEAVRDALARRRLLYVNSAGPEVLAFWLGTPQPSDAELAAPPATCPYRFSRAPNGQIVRWFTRRALHRPMFSDERAFGNFLLFSRFTRGRGDRPLLEDGSRVPEEWLQAIKAAGDRLTVEIGWQAGDVAMLDNSRFMHGRTAIIDPGERMIATYFGYLNFAIPDAEEPPNALWRQRDFEPPRSPQLRPR